MSDREDRRGNRAGDQQPTIPDGGLGSAMPAWLTERPRWAAPATQEAPPPTKQLPPPDSSPIELSSILDVNDLPAWLQDVARRVERRQASRPQVYSTTASQPASAVPKPRIHVATAPEPAPTVSEPPRAAPVVAPAEPVDEPAPAPEPVELVETIEPEAVEAFEFEEEPEADSVELELAEETVDEPVSEAETDGEDALAASEDDDPADAQDETSDSAKADEEVPAERGLAAARGMRRKPPIDWQSVRREAETIESEPVAGSNSLLAKNPPVRVDPVASRTETSRPRAIDDRPWWMSDAAIGVLLVALVLTMIYVILVASGVL